MSESVKKEMRPPYVVAAGEGESELEWRYQRTETVALEGVYEMAMIAQIDKDTKAEAFISLAGSVVARGQRTDVVWEIEDTLARVPLRLI